MSESAIGETPEPDRSPATSDEQRSLVVPLVAIGIVAAAAVGGYLLARYLRTPSSPAEQARRLISSCERLIRDIHVSLTDLHQAVSDAAAAAE